MESLLILSSDTQGLDPLGCDGVVWNATSGMRRRRRRPLEAALVESNLFHCVPFRAALVCSSGSSSADVIHSFVTALKKKEQNNEIQPSPPASERGFTEFLHRVLRIVSRWIGCIRFALVDLLLKWEKNERINSCRCSFLSFIELRIGHCGVFLYQKIFMPPHFHAMNWFCIVGFSEFYRNRMDVLFFSLPCDDVFEIRFQYLFIPIVSIDPLVVWSLDHTKDNKPSMKKKIIGRVSLCVSFGIYRFSSCLLDWTELCCIKQLSSLLRVSLVQTDKTRRNIKDVCFLEWSEPFRPLTLLILLYFLFLLSHWPADVGRNAHELYRVSPS